MTRWKCNSDTRLSKYPFPSSAEVCQTFSPEVNPQKDDATLKGDHGNNLSAHTNYVWAFLTEGPTNTHTQWSEIIAFTLSSKWLLWKKPWGTPHARYPLLVQATIILVSEHDDDLVPVLHSTTQLACLIVWSIQYGQWSLVCLPCPSRIHSCARTISTITSETTET